MRSFSDIPYTEMIEIFGHRGNGHISSSAICLVERARRVAAVAVVFFSRLSTTRALIVLGGYSEEELMELTIRLVRGAEKGGMLVRTPSRNEFEELSRQYKVKEWM